MQKRRRETVLIVLALALVAGIGFIGTRVPPAAPNSAAPTVGTESATSSDALYSFDVEYPVFSGLPDALSERGLNVAVRNEVQNAMESFRQETAGDAGPGTAPLLDDTKNSFVMRYAIGLATPSLVSVRFEVSTFASGAIHPLSSTDVLNYDVERRKTLGLDDIFLPDSGYLETLSEYATKALLDEFKGEEGAVGPMIQEGAGPAAENFQNILLAKDGLLIVFDPYQVAPYAAGTLTVTVPYSELEGSMNPNVLSLVTGR